MLHRSRAIFLFLTIVAVLLVSAVGTTNVYADDGTPPPTETEEVAPPAGEEEPVVPEPTEAAPVEEPVVTEPPEAAPTEEPVVPEPEVTPAEEPVATEPPAEEAPVVEEPAAAEPEPDVASILEQVPDNTTVTVLNSEGEAQPLTTQESANAIIVGDPIWCPANVVIPSPGANGCTEPKANFTELLNFLKTNETDPAYQRDGKIFVEMDEYVGEETSIDFNTYDFQQIKNHSLTIQGGWNTATNSTISTTQFDIPIVIGSSTNPWGGSLTISNIKIDGVSDQTALTLFSLGAVNVFTVEITDSQAGAELNAGTNVSVQNSKFNDNKKFGAKINAGGIVQVVDSEFNNNRSSHTDGFGLEIDNQNEVNLSGVSAQHNEKFGADINSTGPVQVMGGFFSGNIAYSGYCSNKTPYDGYGLKVVTTSWAYLDEGVQASGNYFYGAHLETGVDGAYVYNSSFIGNEPASTSKTQKQGLEIVSAGLVDIFGVHADSNLLGGANVQAVDEVLVTNSFFDGNKSAKCGCSGTTYYGYGLQVVTDGNVTMDTVSASGNHLVGAHLEGFDIAILNGTFDNNGTGNKTLTGKGLEILSDSQVALENVSASNNQLFGADIRAVGNVAITTGFFNGHKYTYSSCQGTVTVGGYGLQVVTDGEIALDTVQASNNYLYGARLDGADVAIGGSALQHSLFNNNQSGLEIKSTGTVALRYVEANDNKLFGSDITAAADVAVRDSFFSGNKSAKCGCNGTTYYGYGLKVVTTGAVRLLDVTAEENYLYGAHLEGTDVRVTALNLVTSSFSNNGTGTLSDHIGKGLEIKSTGADSVVTLSGVTANNNQLFGADVKADGLVFVDNSFFSGNKSYTSTCYCKTYDGYGLKVVTGSDIELDAVTANGNYLFGAHLEGANVKVNNSFFNENSSPEDKNATGRGLEVVSTGDVTLSNVNANDNQLFGANVQAAGQVHVLASTFARNIYYTYSSCKGTKSAGYGLKVVAAGPIFLGSVDDPTQGVQASENGAEGAILDGDSTVDVYDSIFNNNGANGLTITADGNVMLFNVTADGNKGNGVEVKGVCTNTVTVKGGHFAQNSKYGIKVVDAAYAPDGTQFFADNGSGDFFHSDCVSGADDGGNAAAVVALSSDTGSSDGDSDGDNHYQHHHHSHGGWHWYGHSHSRYGHYRH